MKNLLTVSCIVLLVLSCAGCIPEDNVYRENLSQVEYLKAKARLVKFETAGTIDPLSEVQVIFHEDQVPESEVGKTINMNVFQFAPSINGTTAWKDRRTISLKPSISIPANRTFTGYLDLQLLFGLNVKSIKRINMKFQTSGQQILSFKHEFVPVDKTKPLRVYLKGTFQFSSSTSVEALQKHIQLYEGSQKLGIRFFMTNPKEFYFTTDPYTRTSSHRVFDLYVPAAELFLSEPVRNKLYLYSVSSLYVTSVMPSVEKSTNRIRVEFSYDLDELKNYDGFVQVWQKHGKKEKTPVSCKIKCMKNALTLTGDFRPGQEYTVSVIQGLKAKNATFLEKNQVREVFFPDIKPVMVFQHDGVYLPSSNRKKIAFSTINLCKVRLEVKQVFDHNLGFFLQDSGLSSKKDRNDLYYYELNRVGVKIHEEILEIGQKKNVWLKSELELSKIFNKYKDGLFVIELRFLPEDTLVDKALLDWNHMSRHERIVKPVILSDIALIAKRGNNSTTVIVTDLISTKPVQGASVKAYSYQNHLLKSGVTDSQGICELATSDAYFLEAEYKESKALLKFSETELETSLFNTGGATAGKSGIRCFSYTDRGVYRPGDDIHLSLIIRNSNTSFPDNHPVKLVLYNPLKRKVQEIMNKDSRDGFCTFKLSTSDDAMTGNWEAKIHVGDQVFYHTLKIETVVPYKLKVDILPEKKVLLSADREIAFKVESNYLFGTPASGNRTSSKITVNSANPVFPEYKEFYFAAESRNFTPVTSPEFEDNLSAAGQAQLRWTLPEFSEIPGLLKVIIESTVFENGGRQVLKTAAIPYNFYSHYVGALKPENEEVKTGEAVKIPVILVDHEGKPVKGRKIDYRLYRNNHYWWWDYSNRENFRKHFKTNVDTELVMTDSLTSGDTPAMLQFTLEDSGEMLLEIQDGDSGHCCSFFLSAHSWGSESRGRDANIIQIKTSQKKYSPGDKAVVTVKCPAVGAMLMTVEKGDKLLSTVWKSVTEGENSLEIPVTADMAPTSYVTIMLIQPHAQTTNDRPIRMYGISPLNIEDSSTRLAFKLEAPDAVEPETEFSVRIQTENHQKAQFTLAIVDEGLLDLTAFNTPSPWDFFFQKESLAVRTFDIFSDVIGANWGEIFKVFSIGGGDWESEEKKRQSPVKVKRFKPVALFRGPFETDEKGEFKTSFKMPNYIGSVKVMAVGARAGSYGKNECRIKVTSPVMVMPTIPRALAPGDEFEIPVTLFSMENNIGKIKLTLATEGPVAVIGTAEQDVYSNTIEEKILYFRCQAREEVGKAVIRIQAESEKYTSRSTTDIAVRPVNPFMSETTTEILEQGKTVKMAVPGEVIKNSSSAKLIVSRYPDLNFEHRLKWLVNYPYGCIEQTVSSAFPQLYLNDLTKLSPTLKAEVDRNINKTIKRLQVFQTIRGSFSYWPNGSDDSSWGTNYAGHFIVEARKKGYYVPDQIFNNWLNYQKERTLVIHDNVLERTYRLYILSLAGSPQAGPMNLLKENNLIQMTNTERWLLAGAYFLAGDRKTSGDIASVSKLEVPEYIEFSNNFGSTLRDRSIILEVLALLGKFESGLPVFKEIAVKLASKNWYSTQATAYALLAVHKYITSSSMKSGNLKAAFKGPAGKETLIDTGEILYSTSLNDCLGSSIEITNQSEGKIFVSIAWEGIPKRGEEKELSRNFKIALNWYDEEGNEIDCINLDQGSTFWGHIRLSKPLHQVEEVALVQILPSGWEIENTRLNNTQMPEWTSSFDTLVPKYTDLRDDRIMWFFDAPGNKDSIDFLFKLNSVTAGRFYLSPTVVESMYNDQYKAVITGKEINVIRK